MQKITLLLLLCSAAVLATSHGGSGASPAPHILESLQVNETQTAGTCSYVVVITTSCYSPAYTRDRISLSFGDAYGNQVYVPRLDNPRSGTFESCSTDTFTINGPCTYEVCHLYLYRSGYDGWAPVTVTVRGYYTKAVSFYYNVWIPGDVWYGFNRCNGQETSSASALTKVGLKFVSFFASVSGYVGLNA